MHRRQIGVLVIGLGVNAGCARRGATALPSATQGAAVAARCPNALAIDVQNATDAYVDVYAVAGPAPGRRVFVGTLAPGRGVLPVQQVLGGLGYESLRSVWGQSQAPQPRPAGAGRPGQASSIPVTLVAASPANPGPRVAVPWRFTCAHL